MAENSLSPASIANNLKTRFIGQKVFYYASLPSTNDVARQEARWGAPAGTIIIADEQTAGRGRIKRTWLSPKGSIALSVILRPNIAYLPNLIMLASLAVVYAIDRVTAPHQVRGQIKWPNDVLINGKKVCGILIESEIRGHTLDYAIIGIGINANVRMSDYPELLSVATSLSEKTGKEISRLDIIRQLLIEMEKLYLALPQGETVYEQWKAKLVTLGKMVRVETGDTTYEGTAESVAKDGSLMLRQDDGSLVKIVVGDVTLAREVRGG